MADADAFKAAEQRCYSKGYAAGQRSKQRAVAVDRRNAVTLAFRQRAFLAVLPWVFEQDRWGQKVNGKHEPFKSVEERVGLAWRIADEAVDSGVKRGAV